MFRLPADAPVEVSDPFDISGLVSYLRRSIRERPTVVITASKSGALPIDPAQCFERAGGSADVVVLRSRDAQQRFSDLIGKERHIYSGGIRIYPADDFWWKRPTYARWIAPYDAFEPQTMDNVIMQINRSVRITTEERAKTQRARMDAAQRRADEQSRGLSTSKPTPRPVPSPAWMAAHNNSRNKAPRTGRTAQTSKTSRNNSPNKAPQKTTRPTNPTSSPRAASVNADVPHNRVWTVTNDDEAATLGRYLLDPTRQLPVAVLTRAAGRDEPFADSKELLKDVGDIAVIVDMASGGATWALSCTLPKGLKVYGGACRVYPTGDWTQKDSSAIPLFYAFSIADRTDVTNRIKNEVMRLHYQNGYSSSTVQTAETVRAEGTIGDIFLDEGRVLLKLDGGSLAWIYKESLPFGLPAERLLQHGMRVKGNLQRSTWRFDLDTADMRTPAQALAGYHSGMTVLTRVASVFRDTCKLELFPGFHVAIAREDAGGEEDLRTELRKGETVPALIVERSDDSWLLSILEAGPHIEPAPSVFPGGPPWIVPGQTDDGNPLAVISRTRRFADTDVDTLIPPDADEKSMDLIHGIYNALVDMQHDLDMAEKQLKASETSNTQLRASNRQLRAERKAMQRRLEASDPIDMLAGKFADEREQLDFEIRVAWALHIPAGDKANHPLCEWDYAPQFFESLHDLQGFDHSKVVDVIVDILTGLVREIDGRDVHQLRTGEGGDNPVRRTRQGDIYWRAALQLNSPGGRRIHYYRRRDGTIVLSSVRIHDDYRA